MTDVKSRLMRTGLAGLTSFALAACAMQDAPLVTAAAGTDAAAMRADDARNLRLAEMMARMTIEQKVAQLVQPDIGSITAQDVQRYRFGTILNGGNSGPYGNDLAPASDWLKFADEVWAASNSPLPGNQPVIPTMWGTDAVHGHSNIIGATIFPHNIGLGATRDADLLERIGAATALEIEVTGIDWTFAPTIAVARDDRWGRTYESYSEDPAIVAPLGAAMVRGLQGTKGSQNYLGEGRIAATAKHFFGDGGTEQGVDQGDVNGDIDRLIAIHAAPYPAVIDAGVESVMASFNSINGTKMHGNKTLLTGLLRERMGFDGVVVGDWNGHGQIAGCTNTNCPQALLAGLDIYMVPEEWKGLLETLVSQVEDGTIPMARLDEAVMRVLRMKDRAGLFDDVTPSARQYAGDYSLLGSAEHRALAREAVAKSLVILKNDGVLPLKSGARIHVAGSAANDIAQQAGGWTLTWQGGGTLDNSYFPGATSIFAGIEAQAAAMGASATFAEDGAAGDADVAIIVFGEEPYAEFAGDRKNLAWNDEQGLKLIEAYKARGVKTVAVFLSGRPMWVNRELNRADAFVAAWLPGSEGGGVADVLFAARPATGKLSFSWPRSCDGAPLNGPDGALFPVGYGLSLDEAGNLPTLSEDCAALAAGGGSEWFAAGRLGQGVTALAGEVELPDLRGNGAGINVSGIDRNAQEDARIVRFGPGASLTLRGPVREEPVAYRIAYAVDARPADTVTLSSGPSSLDISQAMLVAEGKGWREMVVTRECLATLGGELTFTSAAPFTIKIADIVRDDALVGAECSF